MPALPCRPASTRCTPWAALPDHDIGAALDLEELLLQPSQVDGVLPELPVSAYGQAVDSGRVRALAKSAPAVARAEPEPADAQAQSMATSHGAARRSGRPRAEPRNGATAIVLEDVHTGLDAFCRGAGIEPEQLPAEAQGRLLHLAGRLFREALVGFKELERTRGETRNRYRIELPPQEPDDPRPSLADSMVEDLLVELFVRHETRSLDSVQWLRETVGEAKLHETATAQATRARSSNSSTGWTPPSSRRASSAPRVAARHAPPTRRSTGTCSRPSTAISSRCLPTICRTRSSRRSPRLTARR